MAKKKPKKNDVEDVATLLKAPDKLNSPFAKALAGIKVEAKAVVAAPAKKSFSAQFEARKHPDAAPAPAPKAAPAPVHAGRTMSMTKSKEDMEALHDAFAGVRPLSERDRRRLPRPPLSDEKPVPRGEKPDYIDADAEVRRRLGALVGEAMHFDIVKDAEDGWHGTREREDETVWMSLTSDNVHIDDSLDLHGLRSDDAESQVVKFVRLSFRRGARTLRIVHGKGLHSGSGIGVLREAVLHALTHAGAAPLVVAFASAHARHGGSGATIVRLGAKY